MDKILILDFSARLFDDFLCTAENRLKIVETLPNNALASVLGAWRCGNDQIMDENLNFATISQRCSFV
jgi:hypothetical protein